MHYNHHAIDKLTTTLQLYPWRDGYEITKQKLLDASDNRQVQISFSEYEFKEYLQEPDAIRLFEEIGSNPKLESVTIELDVFSQLPTSVAIPPIAALTSMLTQNNHIRDLTLSQLQLESHNDLDINGMVEALRIHPTLQRIQVKNCTFSKPSHLHRLRKTLVQREGIKHCDLLDNRISFSTEDGEEKIDYEQYYLQEEKEEWQEDEEGYQKDSSSWSWRRWSPRSLAIGYPRFAKICLFCFSLVTAFLAARLLQEPATTWDHHYSLLPSLSSFPSASNLFMYQSSQEVPKSRKPLLSGMSRQHLFGKNPDADGKRQRKKKGRNKRK